WVGHFLNVVPGPFSSVSYNQIKLNIGRHICLSVYLCLYKKAYLCASDFLWEKAKTYTLRFSIVV
ncbi:hypothetical protein, partial [Bacteroides uniformis]|uniref:hypothetical protein n=1 Tax=Bacteroides uniformis TaxID=820 RepID=UPI001E4A9A95